MSDPRKAENMISMVRTFAPLTSTKTISKVNTYLPAVEKVSTLLGMYSFLNRAQTFKPLESLDAKSPMDKISALMKNGNIPVGKLLAQPILANNMDKIMSTMAMNMVKNGNFNDILSSMTNKGTGDKQGEANSDFDLSSLMETFMPLINSLASNSPENLESNGTHENSSNKTNEQPTYSGFKSELNLPIDSQEIKSETQNTTTKKPENHDKHVNHKPIRIKQRKRR